MTNTKRFNRYWSQSPYHSHTYILSILERNKFEVKASITLRTHERRPYLTPDTTHHPTPIPTQESYGMSIVSYFKKSERKISGAHCMDYLHAI